MPVTIKKQVGKATQPQGDVKKLPKWAQEYIEDIEREREVAIRALNKYMDQQTPAPFFIEDLESTGEEQGPSFKVRYIQSHNMSVKHAGVQLDVRLRDDAIDLQWHDAARLHADVAMVPRSYNKVHLVAHENMRTNKKSDKQGKMV